MIFPEGGYTGTIPLLEVLRIVGCGSESHNIMFMLIESGVNNSKLKDAIFSTDTDSLLCE